MTLAELDGPHALARREIVHALFAFFGLWLLAAAASMALGVVVEPGATPTREQIQLGLAVQSAASLIVLLASALHPTAAPLRGRGRVASSVLIYFAFLLVWVPVAYLLVPWVWEHAGWPMAPQPHLEYLAGPLTFGWALVTVSAVCLVGPLFEEVVFRGYLQTGLAGLYGPRAAVFWSGLVFGLIHVGAGFHVLLPLAMIGWLLGWLRERSGGLLAPLVVHVLHNSLTVVLVIARPEVLELTYRTR